MSDLDTLPIREFADRGTLWLLESPENLRGLLQILAKDIADRLDFSKAERINRSFVPDNLQKEEADLLYRVPYRDGTGEVLIYLLLEHQSRPDKKMGLRLLSYMVELWRMQERALQDARIPVSQWQLHPIIPIVFYTGRRKWTSSLGLDALMKVPTPLSGFVPKHQVLFLNLQQTPPEVLKQANTAIAWVLRALQAEEEPQEVLASALVEVVSALTKLPEEAQAEWRRAMRFLLLLIHHKREPIEHEALEDIVVEAVDARHREEIEEMAKTSAQVLMEQGRREGLKEGRLEGRNEGRLEGERAFLVKLLTRKFGALPESVVAAVNTLTERQLENCSERVLTAETLADVGL